MKLQHIAFWTQDINTLVDFYQKYWQAKVLFKHQSGDFSCVFIEVFSCVKLEIMTRKGIPGTDREERVGYSHLSIQVDSKEEVNRLTDYCLENKIPLQKVKEQYDDGYYESSFLDPDGNIVEIAYVDPIVNPAVL